MSLLEVCVKSKMSRLTCDWWFLVLGALQVLLHQFGCHTYNMLTFPVFHHVERLQRADDVTLRDAGHLAGGEKREEGHEWAWWLGVWWCHLLSDSVCESTWDLWWTAFPWSPSGSPEEPRTSNFCSSASPGQTEASLESRRHSPAWTAHNLQTQQQK